MGKILYFLGRAMQLLGLMVMPSAIWVGQFQHDEKTAITVFLSSIFIFFAGYFLTGFSSKL